MYSFGMVMWEMAANCTIPFKKALDDEMAMALIEDGEQEVLPEDTPVKYASLVKRCWNQNPAERPEAHHVQLLGDPPRPEIFEDLGRHTALDPTTDGYESNSREPTGDWRLRPKGLRQRHLKYLH
ncbi:hypothetical protein BGZ73_009204 [Actinomortierella ambigua]|nr:hypothetical protein BGZ73_009204 [Actinomortierella ambigua]